MSKMSDTTFSKKRDDVDVLQITFTTLEVVSRWYCTLFLVFQAIKYFIREREFYKSFTKAQTTTLAHAIHIVVCEKISLGDSKILCE